MNSFMQQIYLKKGTFSQKRGLIEKKWCSISSSNPAVQPTQGETWEQGLMDRPTVKQLKYRAREQWIENLLPRPLSLPNRGLSSTNIRGLFLEHLKNWQDRWYIKTQLCTQHHIYSSIQLPRKHGFPLKSSNMHQSPTQISNTARQHLKWTGSLPFRY